MNLDPRRDGGTSAGFSLLEVLVVMAIIATLVAVATPAYYNHLMRSRQSVAVGELMTLKAAEERYFADNGGYASRINLLDGYSVAGTYSQGPYSFWIEPATSSLFLTAGTIMAGGDLNNDGVAGDVWALSLDKIGDKPDNISSTEGFSWSSLGEIFSKK